MLAIDGETDFSWELLGRPPFAPQELVPVYAALLVAAMGLDVTDVAIMIPGVRLADIRRASRLLEKDRALRRANDVVVAFMLAQPLSKAWGYGDRNDAQSWQKMAVLDLLRFIDPCKFLGNSAQCALEP